MANILVYIAARGVAPSAASLAALLQARRLATHLGATLHALVPTNAPPPAHRDAVAATLATHGADQVGWVTHEQLGPPALYATHAKSLLAAHRRFPAQLVIFPADPAGRALAPALAAQLDATYAPLSTLVYDDDRVTVEHHTFRRSHRCLQTLTNAPRPVVLLLDNASAPSPQRPTSDRAAVRQVEISLDGDPLGDAGLQLLDGPHPTGGPSLTLGGGSGLGTPEAFAKLEQLARALGARVVATAAACEQGLAPGIPHAGLGGCGIDSDLYLAFGVSGSTPHLAALAPHTEVFAVHPDAGAPIFSVARFGLLGSPAATIEALLARASGKPRNGP